MSVQQRQAFSVTPYHSACCSWLWWPQPLLLMHLVLVLQIAIQLNMAPCCLMMQVPQRSKLVHVCATACLQVTPFTAAGLRRCDHLAVGVG
jgi:hypothetical protein